MTSEHISAMSPKVSLRSGLGLQMAERLQHITGFVTTVTGGSDLRPLFFARYYHVQRVVWVAKRLARLIDAPTDAVVRLGWLHDLNRWAFAHNSESGQYRQADEMPELVRRLRADGEEIPESDIDDLVRLHHKELAGMTAAGRCTLLADMLCGVAEDTLMATVGLNLHPEFIPADIKRRMGWTQAFIERDMATTGSQLRSAIRADPELRATIDEFNQLFAYGAVSLLRGAVDSAETIETDIYGLAAAVKKGFLIPEVFPVNNEKVCHASWLRKNVIEPFLENTQSARDDLAQYDEPELIERLRHNPFIDVDFSHVVPELDYVSQHESGRAFQTAGRRQ